MGKGFQPYLCFCIIMFFFRIILQEITVGQGIGSVLQIIDLDVSVRRDNPVFFYSCFLINLLFSVLSLKAVKGLKVSAMNLGTLL